MTVELALHIGSVWIQDEDAAYVEAFAPYNAKYGRSIRQVSYVDLSTVARPLWELVEKYQKIQQERFEASGEFWHITTRVQRDDDEVNLVRDSYDMLIPCIPLHEVREAILSIKGWAGVRQYALAMAIIDTYLEHYPKGGDLGSPVALAYGH